MTVLCLPGPITLRANPGRAPSQVLSFYVRSERSGRVRGSLACFRYLRPSWVDTGVRLLCYELHSRASYFTPR